MVEGGDRREDGRRTGGVQADDIVVIGAWTLAIGLVLAAALGSILLIAPLRQVLEAVQMQTAQRSPPAEPAGGSEASVELGVLYPVNGPVPNETELRAAGMSGAEEAAETSSAERAPTELLTLAIVVNPSWLEQPRPDFPSAAAYLNMTSGRVQLECFVRPDGVIAACMVLDETPPGYDFGRAAIASTRDARLAPRSVDGVATPGRIRFTISFRLA